MTSASAVTSLVDVVIVNWNSGFHLQNCIDSAVLVPGLQIIVVDNASSDDSCRFIDSLFDLNLVRSASNLGFGAACNLGSKHTSSKYLLFLNPDATICPKTLEYCVDFMQSPSNANVGICGVQLVNENGFVAQTCSRFPSPFRFLIQSLGLDRLFPIFGQLMAEWSHDTTQDVDQVIGAFFLVRSSLFLTLGGFDERFYVYYEEVDFSYRARLAGWRSVYLADVQAFHAGGGTSNQVKAKRLFYSLRSRILYAFKHFSLPGALLVLISTFLIEPISRCSFAIFRRSRSSFLETLSGYGMLIQWLPQWLFKGVTR